MYFVDLDAMLSIESMGYSTLRVYFVNYNVSILLLTGSKDDKFIEFGHLEKERFKTKSFNCIHMARLIIERNLNYAKFTVYSKS